MGHLLRGGSFEMRVRLDAGGFSRYDGHGPGTTGALVSPAFLDSVRRAAERGA